MKARSASSNQNSNSTVSESLPNWAVPCLVAKSNPLNIQVEFSSSPVRLILVSPSSVSVSRTRKGKTKELPSSGGAHTKKFGVSSFHGEAPSMMINVANRTVDIEGKKKKKKKKSWWQWPMTDEVKETRTVNGKQMNSLSQQLPSEGC